jgi:hypothetical protein
VAHYLVMFSPARLRLTAALLAALLGVVVPLCETTRELLEDPLAMQVPQR